MKKAYNPYLPTYEYVPDGEPHVFGNRIYLYGSHDRFNGGDFCLNDYVCYSAPVTDLTDWSYEGVIYRKDQDVRNHNIPADAPRFRCPIPGITVEDPETPAEYAGSPCHVGAGCDPGTGRTLLSLLLSGLSSPDRRCRSATLPPVPMSFLGLVRHADGTPLGDREGD